MTTEEAAKETDTTKLLEARLAMLRRMGVSEYGDAPGGGFAVKFFAPEAATEKKAVSNDPDMCACGHEEFKHMNGPCVEGCTAEQCEKGPNA